MNPKTIVLASKRVLKKRISRSRVPRTTTASALLLLGVRSALVICYSGKGPVRGPSRADAAVPLMRGADRAATSPPPPPRRHRHLAAAAPPPPRHCDNDAAAASPSPHRRRRTAAALTPRS